MEFSTRTAVADDAAFIYATMLRGLYYGNEFYGLIDKASFFRNYTKVIESLFRNSHIEVVVLRDEPDIILGYSITNEGVLHFVFVKQGFRKLGIAKSLVEKREINTVTHLTHCGNIIRVRYKWLFDPFLVP